MPQDFDIPYLSKSQNKDMVVHSLYFNVAFVLVLKKRDSVKSGKFLLLRVIRLVFLPCYTDPGYQKRWFW